MSPCVFRPRPAPTTNHPNDRGRRMGWVVRRKRPCANYWHLLAAIKSGKNLGVTPSKPASMAGTHLPKPSPARFFPRFQVAAALLPQAHLLSGGWAAFSSSSCRDPRQASSSPGSLPLHGAFLCTSSSLLSGSFHLRGVWGTHDFLLFFRFVFPNIISAGVKLAPAGRRSKFFNVFDLPYTYHLHTSNKGTPVSQTPVPYADC